MSSAKMITLKSSDNECFTVEESVAMECKTIKNMIEDDCVDGIIPLPNVTSKILTKVIEYCNRHANTSDKSSDGSTDKSPGGSADKSPDVDIKAFDAKFVKVNKNNLIHLTMAADYLDIKSLFDLTCRAIADKIEGKTPEKIRKILNVDNDFTSEEEEEIRRENAWAF